MVLAKIHWKGLQSFGSVSTKEKKKIAEICICIWNKMSETAVPFTMHAYVLNTLKFMFTSQPFILILKL